MELTSLRFLFLPYLKVSLKAIKGCWKGRVGAHPLHVKGEKTLNVISKSRCLTGGCTRTAVTLGSTAPFPSVSCPQELLPKNHRIMDQNILSWKEPPGSPSPTLGPAQDTQQFPPCAWKCCPHAPGALAALVPYPLPCVYPGAFSYRICTPHAAENKTWASFLLLFLLLH